MANLLGREKRSHSYIFVPVLWARTGNVICVEVLYWWITRYMGKRLPPKNEI